MSAIGVAHPLHHHFDRKREKSCIFFNMLLEIIPFEQYIGASDMKQGISQLDLALNTDNNLTGLDKNGRSVDIALDTTTATNLRVIGLFSRAARPGDVMPDGSLYAGVSSQVRIPFFVAASNAPTLLDWDNANEYAKKCAGHGHSDWALPTIKELQDIATKSSFKEAFGKASSEFWSSDRSTLGGARHMNIQTKQERLSNRSNEFSVCCIRYMRGMF